MTNPSALPYLWMLLGSLAFASMATLAHVAGTYCDWQVIAVVRTGLCLALMTLFALAAGVRLVLFRPRTLWLRSIAGSISLVCTFYAFPRLPVADVLTLTNVFPIWVVLLSWPMLGEVPPRSTWLAVASGIAGVALIQQPHIEAGNFATLVALLSSVTTAFAMLGLHRLHHVDARAVVVHFSAVSLAFALAAFFAFERRAPGSMEMSGSTLWLLLGVGVTATIGQLFLTKAFAAGPPSRVAVVGLSQVAFGGFLDFVVSNQEMGLMKLAGMMLVLAPTAWLLLHRPRPEPEPADLLTE